MLKVLEKLNIIKLKNIFVSNLFIITLVLVLNIYINNIYFFIISILYVLYRLGFKSLILLLLIILILFSRLELNNKFIKYAYVSSKNNKLILNNLLYQIETSVIDTNDYQIGDIVEIKYDNLIQYTSIDKYKNNIYFKYNDTPIKTNYRLYTLRHITANKIDNISDTKLKAFAYKFILLINDYDNLENEIIDASFSIYALYLIFYKILNQFCKSKWIKDLFIVFLMWELYDINLNSIRIILMIIYYNQCNNKITALTNISIILLLYNPYSIYSTSFILPLGIRLLMYFKNNLDIKLVIFLFQSILFGSISIIKLAFYKYYLYIYSIIYVLLFLFLYINQYMIKYIYEFIKLIESINIFDIKGQLNLFVFIILMIFIKEFKIQNKFLIKVLITLTVLSNISNIYASVNYIDVGQGDSILIKSPYNSENILIDTGNKYNYYKLKQFLDKKGIYQIDYLVITHFDSDHCGNLNSLVNDYKIKQIIYDHKDIDTKYINLKSLNSNIWNDENDNSLVYYMKYNGLDYLFSGDISSNVEDYLLNQNPNLNIDILKLSHHGSNSGNSMQFLYYTKPIVAIASTSGMYNHPHYEVINNCDMLNIKTFITKINSDIEIITTKLLTFIYAKNGEFVIIK